jgi:uncharacterized cupredoxin-like copper-binding protein
MTTGSDQEGRDPDDVEPMSSGTKVGLATAAAVGILFLVFLIIAAQHSNPSSAASSATPTTTVSGTTAPPTPTGPGVVHVTLSDTKGLNGPMTLVADKRAVPAGKITFVIKNTGTIEHELVVLKLTGSQTWEALPVTDAGDPPVPVTSGANKVSEANDVADTGTNLKPGETRTLDATLAAGSYALVCNIAKHYGLGMRAGLTVS